MFSLAYILIEEYLNWNQQINKLFCIFPCYNQIMRKNQKNAEQSFYRHHHGENRYPQQPQESKFSNHKIKNQIQTFESDRQKNIHTPCVLRPFSRSPSKIINTTAANCHQQPKHQFNRVSNYSPVNRGLPHQIYQKPQQISSQKCFIPKYKYNENKQIIKQQAQMNAKQNIPQKNKQQSTINYNCHPQQKLKYFKVSGMSPKYHVSPLKIHNQSPKHSIQGRNSIQRKNNSQRVVYELKTNKNSQKFLLSQLKKEESKLIFQSYLPNCHHTKTLQERTYFPRVESYNPYQKSKQQSPMKIKLQNSYVENTTYTINIDESASLIDDAKTVRSICDDSVMNPQTKIQQSTVLLDFFNPTLKMLNDMHLNPNMYGNRYRQQSFNGYGEITQTKTYRI